MGDEDPFLFYLSEEARKDLDESADSSRLLGALCNSTT